METLEKENGHLRTENKRLKEVNERLSKEVVFYKRVVDSSIKGHRNEAPDLEVVTEVADGYYQRVEEGKKGNGFVKAFLLLTIFTVMVQTVNVSGGGGEGFVREAGTARLNSYDPEGMDALRRTTSRWTKQRVGRVGSGGELAAVRKHPRVGGRCGDELQETNHKITENRTKKGLI